MRPPRILAHLVVAFATVALAAGHAPAAIKDDIGYTRLSQELGASLSTGNSVSVIQSEAIIGTGPTAGYFPNASHGEFVGKTITNFGSDPDVSSHAHTVAKNFYGQVSSISPGVATIGVYSANDWLGSAFLRTGSGQLPNTSNALVANHSWYSTGADGNSLNSLHRMDWLVETDDLLQVAGTNNSSGENNPGSQFANAFNVLMVGVTRGTHATGGEGGLAFPYTGAQVRPHLVVPMTQTSFAAPYVSGAAALLIDASRDHPSWSNGTKLTSAGRSNRTINFAETTEVIRATLMAGADRQAITAAVSGSNYTVNSPNGLDSKFGAGELDIYHSYHILAAGEQNSRERGNPNNIKLYGFDYEPSFVANTTRTYPFRIDGLAREFAATLAWNADINLELIGGQYIDPSVELTNLNLRLRNVSTGATIAFSNSANDVNENIYIPVLQAGSYELVVDAANYIPTSPFTTDFGLSWRFAPRSTPLAGDVNLDGTVSLADLIGLQRNFGLADRAVWTDGDLNGDFRVDRGDLAILAQQFGSGVSAAAAAPPSANGDPVLAFVPHAVPEPSMVALAAWAGLAVVGAGCYRRMRAR